MAMCCWGTVGARCPFLCHPWLLGAPCLWEPWTSCQTAFLPDKHPCIHCPRPGLLPKRARHWTLFTLGGCGRMWVAVQSAVLLLEVGQWQIFVANVFLGRAVVGGPGSISICVKPSPLQAAQVHRSQVLWVGRCWSALSSHRL